MTTLYDPGTGSNETNAWTIVISSDDATSSAADLNTINASTSAEVNAAEVTTISSSTISDVGTLLTNAAKDGTPDPREFTAGSFDSLGAVTLSDNTITVGDLNTAISNANTVASSATTKFTISNAAALINGGNESAFETLMSKEGAAGTDNINLSSQKLTVTGTISSITNANNFTASTTGVVTGEIVNTTLVSDLTGLTNAQANAKYTVTLNTADSGTVTAANLNRIDGGTTVAVDMGNITALGASNIADLTALNANKDNFTSRGNLATITLTDNGGAASEVDFGALADVIDDAQTNFQNNITFKFQSADTINVNGSTELGKFLTDISDPNPQLTLTDQKISVTGGAISIANARSIAADTTGTVTASIDTASRVADLTTLYNPGGGNEINAWTIAISTDDATIGNAADLNTIDSSTSVAVDASNVTSITGTASALNTTYTAATNGTITGLNAKNGEEAIILSDTAATSASAVHTLKNTIDTLAAAQSPAVTPANINATSVTSFSGVALDLLAVYSAGNTGRITGLGVEDITVDESGSGGDGALSVHDANLLDTYTTGVITATIQEKDDSTLATLTSTSTTGVITGSEDRHKYTVTVTGSADAGNILSLDNITSVSINLESLSTLTGTLAEVEGVFTLDDDSKVSLGSSPNVALTLSDASIAVAQANTLSAQYIDQKFSIKEFKVFVQVLDKATKGCWTNISETKQYIKNKLSETGIQVIDDQSKTDLTLKFSVVAQRTGHGWCYGSMDLNLTANVIIGQYMVLGTFYEQNTVDIKAQHFNNAVLNWLNKRLPELK